MTSRRRLLICTRATNPEGGADRIIADLARELPARGWDVQIAAAHGAQHNRVERYRAAYPDLPVVALDAALGTRASRVRAVRRAVQRFKPDVVLAMRLHDVFEAVAGLKSAVSGPRLAMGLRAFEAEYFNDLEAWKGQIDLCVTSGELIAETCRRLGVIEPTRVMSIGGGVHPPRAPAPPRTPRVPLRLLYCGRFDPQQKRVLDLVPYVEALKALDLPFELELAGSGPAEGELRKRLQPMIESGQVRMLGWCSQPALYEQVYPRADVFVHFAAWEGMTIAPREAMAHGVVPVISDFPGRRYERQFVEGETALSFPIGDAQAAAHATRRLAAEPGLLQRLSRGAICSQQGKYSYAGSIEAWVQALDGCLQMPTVTGPMPQPRERLHGRLARWGLSESAQDALRRVLQRPVRHASPGSEWPSSGRRATLDEIGRYRALASAIESEAQTSAE